MALLAASVVVCDIAAIMRRQVTAAERGSLLRFERASEQFAGRPEDSIDEFVKLAQDSNVLQVEIAAQVWANSVLAGRKYRYVRWALRFLAGALAVSVFAAIAVAFEG
jgi:hypothetical protein